MPDQKPPELQPAVEAALAADRERACELMCLLACPDGVTRARVFTAIRSGQSRDEFTAKFGAELR